MKNILELAKRSAALVRARGPVEPSASIDAIGPQPVGPVIPARLATFAKDVFDRPPAPEPEPAEFAPGLAALVAWFKANRHRLPASPYLLAQGVRVIDSDRFYASLDRDVLAGPRAPRVRFGGLLGDLQALRRKIESGEQ